MHQTTLIIGGCRSGKSRHAMQLGEETAGKKKIFLATCVPQDTEMHSRVERHQAERGAHWQTVEEPIDIVQAIRQHGPAADVCLVDCLTLWVTNLMLAHDNDETVGQCITRLCGLISDPPCELILVTNEVGAGIVPENRLARRFRDMTGWTNQQVAAVCRTVIWMVAGIAVLIKPQDKMNC